MNPNGQIEIDEANKFLYDAANTTTFCFNCTAAIWGATIAGDHTLAPISGAPWQTTGTQTQGTFAIVP